MLQKMRDNAQGTAAKILLGLLVVVFTIFGVGAFQAFIVTDPPAAKVNGEKITRAMLTQEMERRKAQILAQMGDSANPDLIDNARLQRTVLDQLINRQLMLEAAQQMGLTTTPGAVEKAIVDNPQFQTDGHFDPNLYQRLLANAGHSPTSFKDQLTTDITLVQLSSAITESPFVTDRELREAARMLGQKRDFAYVVVSPAQFKDKVTVKDTDVSAYYQAHLGDFMTPETVDVDYVKLSLSDIAKKDAYAPTEEQVTARYESDKAAFKPNEEREVSHILLQVGPKRTEQQAREELTAVRARIEKGEKFEDIARQISEDPGSAANGGDLGFVSKGALAPEFERVAFELPVGKVSEPVKTSFGLHLIKVDAIKKDEFPSLADKHDAIVAQLRREKAEPDYRDKVRALDEAAFESPDSLQHLVDLTGTPAEHVGGVTRQHGSGPFDNASLRDAAFSDDVLTHNSNSRVIEVGDDAYVLRMTAHHEPEQRPLEQVAASIRARLTTEAATTKAHQAAEDIVAKVDAGEGTATSAATYGLTWKVVAGATRSHTGDDAAITTAAFDLPRPTAQQRSVTSTPLHDGDIAVVTVTAVTDGDYAALGKSDIDAIRAQLSRRFGNEDFQSLFQSLHDSASIEQG